MPLATKIPERWRDLAGTAAKFGVVGAINTVIDFFVFNLLLQIGPLKANVVSTVVATTTSYFMNRQWTFRGRARGDVRREYILFFFFNVVGMVIQLAVLGLVRYGLGFTASDGRLVLNIAKAAGIGVAMVFRFWAYRRFVFKAMPAPMPGVATPGHPETGVIAPPAAVPAATVPAGTVPANMPVPAGTIPAGIPAGTGARMPDAARSFR